jgi:hypothetical protein
VFFDIEHVDADTYQSPDQHEDASCPIVLDFSGHIGFSGHKNYPVTTVTYKYGVTCMLIENCFIPPRRPSAKKTKILTSDNPYEQ